MPLVSQALHRSRFPSSGSPGALRRPHGPIFRPRPPPARAFNPHQPTTRTAPHAETYLGNRFTAVAIASRATSRAPRCSRRLTRRRLGARPSRRAVNTSARAIPAAAIHSSNPAGSCRLCADKMALAPLGCRSNHSQVVTQPHSAHRIPRSPGAGVSQPATAHPQIPFAASAISAASIPSSYLLEASDKKDYRSPFATLTSRRF